MRWPFSFGKRNEVLLHESLIKSIKESQYYSKHFLNKNFVVPENIVNKKKHRNAQLHKAILLTEHPNDETQFIFFCVSYTDTQVLGQYLSGVWNYRVINLSEKIPSIHKPENSEDKCNAGNVDNAGWDDVEIFLPGFKQMMQLGMEKQKETSQEEDKDDSLQLN